MPPPTLAPPALAWPGAVSAWTLGAAAVAACALLGLAVALVRLSTVRRQLRALHRATAALLDWSPDAADASRAVREIEAIRAGGEVGGLRAVLAGLGRLLTGQIKELAKRERNLESLIDALDEPLLATGEEGKIILSNRSAATLLAGGAAILDRPIEAVFTQEDLLEIHRAACQGQTRRDRVRVTTVLGARVFQVSAAPLPAAWGGGVFGAVLLLRDVTELDRVEQVRSDFVANASHELRTPIAAIRGAIETLIGGAKDEPEIRDRMLAMALSNAERLEEMTRDLLDLSRLEAPEVALNLTDVHLAGVLETVGGMLEEPRRARRLMLEIDVDPEVAVVRSDERLLSLILRNLLENATKFAYEGTTIRVRARRTGPPNPGGMLRLEVTDRGIGVPLHLRDRVFERYFQVDSARTGGSGAASGKGTGLGLSIVKHAARALGGDVGLESVYREGATVWAELPLRRAARDADA